MCMYIEQNDDPRTPLLIGGSWCVVEMLSSRMDYDTSRTECGQVMACLVGTWHWVANQMQFSFNVECDRMQ